MSSAAVTTSRDTLLSARGAEGGLQLSFSQPMLPSRKLKRKDEGRDEGLRLENVLFDLRLGHPWDVMKRDW